MANEIKREKIRTTTWLMASFILIMAAVGIASVLLFISGDLVLTYNYAEEAHPVETPAKPPYEGKIRSDNWFIDSCYKEDSDDKWACTYTFIGKNHNPNYRPPSSLAEAGFIARLFQDFVWSDFPGNPDSEAALAHLEKKASEFCDKYPKYADKFNPCGGYYKGKTYWLFQWPSLPFFPKPTEEPKTDGVRKEEPQQEQEYKDDHPSDPWTEPEGENA